MYWKALERPNGAVYSIVIPNVCICVNVYIYLFGFSSHGFSVWPCLSSNSLWKNSTCLCLSSAEVKGLCHHGLLIYHAQVLVLVDRSF